MNTFYNGMKDLIISMGADVLKDSAEELHDTKELEKRLGEYMKRERAVFESIDIQQEIDFGALEDYIKENLLNDFKESLCGSNIQKENKKEYILEKLYHYLGVETDSRKSSMSLKNL